MQSARDWPVLDRPPVNVTPVFWFLTSGDLDLWPFQLKIGTPLGNVYTNVGFWTFFVFEIRARTGQTDRQTDRQTDGQDA